MLFGTRCWWRGAASVRWLVGGSGALDTATLNRTIVEAGVATNDTPAARTIMLGCGFLSRSGDSWRAAIPSLADYMRQHPR